MGKIWSIWDPWLAWGQSLGEASPPLCSHPQGNCSWFSCVNAKLNTTDYSATEDRIVQRCEDMCWNNTWLGAFSPILTDEMGQTTSQTAEIMFIREYKSQLTIKRHAITVPSLVSLCSHGHYPHLCTAQSAVIHCTHSQALCHSLTHCPSVQGWQLSFIVSAPSSFHYCLRKCNQNRKIRQRKPELAMSDWGISAQEKEKKIKKIQFRSNWQSGSKRPGSVKTCQGWF